MFWVVQEDWWVVPRHRQYFWNFISMIRIWDRYFKKFITLKHRQYSNQLITWLDQVWAKNTCNMMPGNQKGVSRFQILFAAKIFEILLLLLNFTEYHVTLKSVTIVTGRHANHIIYQKNYKNLRFKKNIDKIEVGIFLQTSFFEVRLFQKPLLNFLWGLRTCSQYLKSPPPNLDLWFDEKIVTARHTNLITCQEITRTVEILKNEAKIKVGIFWKTSFFVVKHF